MASAFEAATNNFAMVSFPSSRAFWANAAYFALAVVSPLIPAFRFSMVFTGFCWVQLANRKIAPATMNRIFLIVILN